jgi:stage II sporulation protein D
VLDLEDYMKGIAEVPNGWQVEAQKAQMVAARTYAVKLRNGPVADIFDLYDDTRSQVYYGYAYESNNPNLAQAAVATAGIIMRYDGQPISSYYYSDSGGYVESVENVWGKGDPARGIPYLVAKPDPYAKPVIWDCTLTQDYLLDRFSEELADAGAISENITDMVISETFPSGRIKTVIITTASGKVINMPFYTFDYLIPNTMAKSNLFTITKTGVTNRPDFLLNGKGNGHGVGLSQYSANNMALQGKTYQDILTFFYTGVVVGSI